MICLDNDMMADIACMTPIYVDGVLGVINLGANFMTCYFRWRAIRSDETGRIVYEKSVAHVLVRPRASILQADGPYASMLAQQGVPRESLDRMALAH